MTEDPPVPDAGVVPHEFLMSCFGLYLTMRGQLAYLADRLLQYGDHQQHCRSWSGPADDRPCTCGWQALERAIDHQQYDPPEGYVPMYLPDSEGVNS